MSIKNTDRISAGVLNNSKTDFPTFGAGENSPKRVPLTDVDFGRNSYHPNVDESDTTITVADLYGLVKNCVPVFRAYNVKSIKIAPMTVTQVF